METHYYVRSIQYANRSCVIKVKPVKPAVACKPRLQQLIDYQYKHVIDGPTMFVHQRGITPKHRAHMVDLLIYVQAHYNLEPSVFFLAVNTIDRYISARMIDVDEIVLVTLSAIGLATRFTQDDIIDYDCTKCGCKRYILVKKKKSPNAKCHQCKTELRISTMIGKYKHWEIMDMYQYFENDSCKEYTRKKLMSMEQTIAGAIGFDLGAVTAYEIAMEGLRYMPAMKARVTKLLKLGMLSTKILYHKPLDIARAAIHIAVRDTKSPILDVTKLALVDLKKAVISAEQYTYASKYA